ncbi:MAG: hypothetical protein D3910_08145 [Candidatus Electrothrix sp. ATG2]|nr:hypothetical protein [Candidatus Electrothrix sp. ATG2]
MYKTSYEKKRDNTKQGFEQLQFNDKKKIETLREICSKSLARYDAEIEWYDGHADRRRFVSGAIRLIAVLFGTASIMFMNIKALGVEFTIKHVFGLDLPIIATGLNLPVIATACAITAGGILLVDLLFQVTSRFARWRVMEYTIRILRTTFEVEFIKKFGALEEGKINRSTFNEAKILAIESFKKVELEIKNETESWQQNLDTAMKTLQQKIDKSAKDVGEASEHVEKSAKDIEKAAEDVGETAKEVSTKTLVAEKKRQETEESEKKKTEPVLLDVMLAKEDRRATPLTLVIVNKSGEEIPRKTNLLAGKTVPFLLIPGPYILRLLDNEDNEITSQSQRLKPGKDAVVSI